MPFHFKHYFFNDDENLENLPVELLVSPREAVKLLDRLMHVDGVSEDDTDSLLVIREKMESLTIQRKKQCSIKTFLNNRMKV